MEIVDIFHSKYTKYGISQCMYMCIIYIRYIYIYVKVEWLYQNDEASWFLPTRCQNPWFQFQKVERIPFPNEWTSSRHILAANHSMNPSHRVFFLHWNASSSVSPCMPNLMEIRPQPALVGLPGCLILMIELDKWISWYSHEWFTWHVTSNFSWWLVGSGVKP